MKNRRTQTLGAIALALAAAGVHAQSYPQRAVRVVVPYAAGGNTDIVARMVAADLTKQWGQQVNVDNRAGGATNIGSEIVARATPDGYTVLMGGASNAINMTLFRKLPYDTLKDFAPVILCTTGANVLAIHPSVPAKNLRELIALAKKQPGALNFATSGIGSSNHMAGELFKMMADIQITHVPYKGNAPALTDAVGGHVEMVFAGVTSLVPLMKSGKLRGIALGALKRYPSVPDLPTFDEAGVPGYNTGTWFGLMAPAGTPRDVITKFNASVDKYLQTPSVRERFIQDGQNPEGGSPERFAQFIKDEIAKYAKLIKAAGIKQR